MRRWSIFLVLLVVFALAGIAYFFSPIGGPKRDLSLAGDVTRGQYVIRLGGCVACHTDLAAGGAYLAGGLPLKTQFGDFVPPNITSDKQAGIGAWTLAEFSGAMSKGLGPGGKHLYPSFPFDSYTKMSDQDIVDLYVALMATDPIGVKAADHQIGFPFNIRLAMQGWKRLFFTPVRFAPDATRSERWNRGAYLANGPAHCGACHTPRNAFGAAQTDQRFAGTPTGTKPFFPAIDPETLRARGYDEAGLIDALTGGFDPDFDTLGGAMGEVINESLLHWTPQDLAALSAYLLDTD
ncbi:c-type cytochrome [Maritalea porphyrae]|uniref:c-type cytochrome n=1 Tax=Maritalea porphyrae TaxID=880732 RepID=UPI0022B06ADB|nr:cytochrome c [Maritalea porphyrae]MCZ4273807.1 cytochrome c [Maritalea porphyrae]